MGIGDKIASFGRVAADIRFVVACVVGVLLCITGITLSILSGVPLVTACDVVVPPTPDVGFETAMAPPKEKCSKKRMPVLLPVGISMVVFSLLVVGLSYLVMRVVNRNKTAAQAMGVFTGVEMAGSAFRG